MGRTVNRTPFTVDKPSVSNKFFNQVNWKGICTNKNYFNIDQETFEDCENIHIDDDGVLKSRPPLKYYGIDSVKRIWNFSKAVYLEYEDGRGENILLELDRNSGEKLYEYRVTVDFDLFEHKNNTFLVRQDAVYVLDKGEHKNASDYTYIPETTIYSYATPNENEPDKVVQDVTEGELKNLLNKYYYETHVFNKISNIPTVNFENKKVYIKLDNDEFDYGEFPPYADRILVSNVGNLPEDFFTDGKANLSFADNGASIAYRKKEGNVYEIFYSTDSLRYVYFKDIQSICDPKISKDGDCVAYIFKRHTGEPDAFSILNLSNGIITYARDLQRTNADNVTKNMVAFSIKNAKDYLLAYVSDYTIHMNYIDGLTFSLINAVDGITSEKNVSVQLPYVEELANAPIALSLHRSTNDYAYCILFGSRSSREQTCNVILGSQNKSYSIHLTILLESVSEESIEDFLRNCDICSLGEQQISSFDVVHVVASRYKTSLGSRTTLFSAVYSDVLTNEDAYEFVRFKHVDENTNDYSNVNCKIGYDGSMLSVATTNGLYYADSRLSNFTNYSKVDNYNYLKFIHDDVIPIYTKDKFYYAVKSQSSYRIYENDTSKSTIIIKVLNEGTKEKINFTHFISLDELYLANGNELLISLDKDDKLYLPTDRLTKFANKITNIFPLSGSQISIFLQNEIWNLTRDGDMYQLHKSKLQVGCKDGADVTSSIDGANVIFSTDNGLAMLSYQDFVQSSDQILSFLSDYIDDLYSKFSQSPVKLYKQKYKLFCYSKDYNFCYVFDWRNNSWWKWRFERKIKGMSSIANKTCFIFDDGSLSYLDNDYEVYDDYGTDEISWHITSQKLNLGTLNYYKNVSSIIFNDVESEDIGTVSFKLFVKNYRSSISDKYDDDEVIEYSVDLLRTYVKKCNSRKVIAFQYTLSNDDETFTHQQLSLNSIIIKYNIGGQVR